MPKKWGVAKRQRTKHIPSGIIIAWLGNDNKIHTQSIARSPAIPELSDNFTKIDAKTKFLCRQLDYLGSDYLDKKGIKSMPIITTGLTRAEAKQILLYSFQQNLQLIEEVKQQ